MLPFFFVKLNKNNIYVSDLNNKAFGIDYHAAPSINKVLKIVFIQLNLIYEIMVTFVKKESQKFIEQTLFGNNKLS